MEIEILTNRLAENRESGQREQHFEKSSSNYDFKTRWTISNSINESPSRIQWGAELMMLWYCNSSKVVSYPSYSPCFRWSPISGCYTQKKQNIGSVTVLKFFFTFRVRPCTLILEYYCTTLRTEHCVCVRRRKVPFFYPISYPRPYIARAFFFFDVRMHFCLPICYPIPFFSHENFKPQSPVKFSIIGLIVWTLRQHASTLHSTSWVSHEVI